MGSVGAFQQALGEFSFAAVQKAADRELLDALVSLRQLQGGQRAFGVGEQPGGKFFQPRRGRAESGVFENEDVAWALRCCHSRWGQIGSPPGAGYHESDRCSRQS